MDQYNTSGKSIDVLVQRFHNVYIMPIRQYIDYVVTPIHSPLFFRIYQVLKRAHIDIPALELTVSQAETELGECERILEMRKDADRRHRHWQDVLAEVQRELTEAEMNFAGQVGEIVTFVAAFCPSTYQDT